MRDRIRCSYALSRIYDYVYYPSSVTAGGEPELIEVLQSLARKRVTPIIILCNPSKLNMYIGGCAAREQLRLLLSFSTATSQDFTMTCVMRTLEVLALLRISRVFIVLIRTPWYCQVAPQSTRLCRGLRSDVRKYRKSTILRRNTEYYSEILNNTQETKKQI